ncbi:MAG TPA: DNRLRE domain-containing protein [Phycisphaeraceae bacterium]
MKSSILAAPVIVGATLTAGGLARADVFMSTPDQDTWVGFFNGGDFGNRNGDPKVEAQGDFADEGRQGRILLYWDLSSIPAGSVVQSASLGIRDGTVYSQPSQSQVEVRAIVPGNPWTQAGATWLTYDGVNAWTNTGVGGPASGTMAGTGNWLDSIVAATLGLPAGLLGQPLPNTPVNLDVTSLVQRWVDGSLENNGLAMQLAEGFDGDVPYVFATSTVEAAPDLAPLLMVEYTVPEPAAMAMITTMAALLLRRRGRSD